MMGSTEYERPRTYSCRGLRKYHDPGGKSHTQFGHLHFFKFLFLYLRHPAKISKTAFAGTPINTMSARKLENVAERFEFYQEAVPEGGRQNEGQDFPEFLHCFREPTYPSTLHRTGIPFIDNLLF